MAESNDDDEGHAVESGRVLTVEVLQRIEQGAGMVRYGGQTELSFLLREKIRRFIHGSFIDGKNPWQTPPPEWDIRVHV